MKRVIILLLIIMSMLLFTKEATGQTIVDSLRVKPETEIVLDFKYDLPEAAAFNDVFAFSGNIQWPLNNGQALAYIPGSAEFAPVWDDFLGITNESGIDFNVLEFAAAGALPVRVDRDTTFVSATFITPSTTEPIELFATGFFKVNESPTDYTHLYVITVDPDLGVGNDRPHKFELDYTATVFPNPAVDGANLQLDIELPQPMFVALYDVTGRKVITIHDGFVNPNQLLSFSVDDLSAGTYFVVASTHHKKVTLPITIQQR